MAINASAARAGLTCVPGVHPDYHAAVLLGRGGQERPHLAEAPAVEPAVLSAVAWSDPFADGRQVLDLDDATSCDGMDDLPTKLVVQVAPQPQLFALQPSEVPTSRAGAFGVQGATEPEEPGFVRASPALPEEQVM